MTPKRSEYCQKLLALLLLATVSLTDGIAQDHGADDTQSLSIALPDGASVSVNVVTNNAMQPSIELDSQLAPMYDSLVSEARSGNVVAARYLGQALDICRGAFSTQSELDAAIAELRTTGNRTYGDGREPVQYNGMSTNEVESAMRKQYQFCHGISKSTALRAMDWTRQAAEAGDYYALQRLIGKIGRNNESFELWHDAFSRGYIWAAQELAYYYLNGIGADMGGVPDYFNAYVYQSIAFKFEEAAMRAGSQSPDEDIITQYNAVLDDISRRLRDDEINQAHKQMAAILRDNSNCCILPGN